MDEEKSIAEEKFIAIATNAINGWLCGWYGDPQILESDCKQIAMEVLNDVLRGSLVILPKSLQPSSRSLQDEVLHPENPSQHKPWPDPSEKVLDLPPEQPYD